MESGAGCRLPVTVGRGRVEHSVGSWKPGRRCSVDDTASDITTTATPEDEPAAPKPVAELNGEPIYGERVESTDADTDAAKRKTED